MTMVSQPPQWAKFPLILGTKRPACGRWQETRPNQYNQPNHFGIVPANSIATPEETFLVIDVDAYKPEGAASLALLKQKLPNIELTPSVETPSGGIHFWFRVPKDFDCKQKQPNYPGCDFQSRERYVVAPGMVTQFGEKQSAGSYNIRNTHLFGQDFYALSVAHFQSLPAEFIATLASRDLQSELPAPEFYTFSMRKEFQEKCGASYPAAVEGQGGNAKTLQLANKGFDFGLPEEIILQDMRELYNPRCEPAWTEHELSRIVTNARKYRKEPIGNAAPEMIWLPLLDLQPLPTNTIDSERVSEIFNRNSKQAIAAGFELRASGLYKKVESKTKSSSSYSFVRVSDPISVVALSFGDWEGGSFYIVRMQDRLGKVREMDIPVKLQHDSKLLAQKLADVFQLEKAEELSIYFRRMHPETKLQSVKKTGWRIPDNDNEKPIFVLPGISLPGIRFVGSSDLASSMVPKGSLKEWEENVWRCAQIPTARYEVYKSLVPTLIPFTETVELVHENIGGLSSTGKTTHLQIGASVWGSAEFPARNGKSSFIIPWNGTEKYMLEIISHHNNLPTYLDEIGTKDAGNFGKFIYAVSSGSERGRCNTDGSSKETRKFQTFITSSGEMTIRTAIEAEGKKAKAGQMLRFTDREITGAFEGPAQVDRIKAGCGKSYGTLGPAFTAWLSSLTVFDLRQKIETLFQAALNRLLLRLAPNLNNEQRRGLQRFAIAEAAGKILCETGFLSGVSFDVVESDINYVADSWVKDSHLISDAERAVEAIKDHVTRCTDSHFKTYSRRTRIVQTPDSVPRQIEVSDDIRFKEGLSGEIDQAGNRFFLYPEAMAEITGMKATDVAKELLKRGLLLPEQTRADHNRLTGRATVEGKQVTVYWISLDLIEDAKPYTWDDVL